MAHGADTELCLMRCLRASHVTAGSVGTMKCVFPRGALVLVLLASGLGFWFLDLDLVCTYLCCCYCCCCCCCVLLGFRHCLGHIFALISNFDAIHLRAFLGLITCTHELSGFSSNPRVPIINSLLYIILRRTDACDPTLKLLCGNQRLGQHRQRSRHWRRKSSGSQSEGLHRYILLTYRKPDLFNEEAKETRVN